MIETLRAYPAPEAVLFDLDGTLVDSVEDIFVAVNALMRELGVAERSREEVTTWVGNGARMLVERAVSGRFEGFAGLPDALARHAAAQGLRLTSLKPHGALSHAADGDDAPARHGPRAP